MVVERCVGDLRECDRVGDDRPPEQLIGSGHDVGHVGVPHRGPCRQAPGNEVPYRCCLFGLRDGLELSDVADWRMTGEV
jgi:hypothetical protein